MPFAIVRQDITKMEVDAIVNAANTSLQMGGGVCGAIFKAAGADRLQAACDKLAPIKTGEAVITQGFDLPSKFIIHAAGPIYQHQNAKESERLLRSAYTESLKLAVENNCGSIAFPLISSGIYGYPKDAALQVATSAIRDFLFEHDIDVYLAIFDKDSFVVSKKLLDKVASYIDEHYAQKHMLMRRQLLDIEREELNEPLPICSAPIPNTEDFCTIKSIEDLFENLDEPFSATLMRLIDAKGKTDVEVYKRANLDRKLFSKIRCNKSYTPRKRTAVALAVALELSIDETNDLLLRAGYALSHSSIFDVIVKYFIENRRYDIFEINEVLFAYDQPLLGG